MTSTKVGLKQQFSVVEMPSPLRVGIMVSSTIQPEWVSKIISIIESSSFANLALVIVCLLDSGEMQESPTVSNFPFLWSFYEKFDNFLYGRQRKTDRKTNTISLFQNCVVINAKSQLKGGIINLVEADIRKIRDRQPELPCHRQLSTDNSIGCLKSDFLH